jgi:hypothetical protein
MKSPAKVIWIELDDLGALNRCLVDQNNMIPKI